MTNTTTRSRVATLGTLAELHREPIQYDLRTLSRLVKDLEPDLLNGQLWLMRRLANSPGAVNSGIFGWVCDCVCRFTAWVSGPQAQQSWDQANQAIINNILVAVQGDPGRRVLVTVDCRRRHRLEQALRRIPEVVLVDYRRL